MRKPLLIFCCIALSACASVPKPPNVNGRHRSQINDAETAELLKLRAESAEWHGQGEVKAVPPKAAGATTRPLQTTPAATPAPALASHTYTVLFGYGSAAFEVPASLRAVLVPLARTASRIEVRGRTDGQRFSVGDELVAFHRARAVRQFLIHNGVAPEKIDLNYVSAGDYAADNTTPAGRTQNRRVEIEVFSASLNQ